MVQRKDPRKPEEAAVSAPHSLAPAASELGPTSQAAEPKATGVTLGSTDPIAVAPLTDLPQMALADQQTPLPAQADAQKTLQAEQQHAGVYVPASDETLPIIPPQQDGEAQEAAASQHPHAARQQAQPQGAGRGGRGGHLQAGSDGPQQRDPPRATTAEAEALQKADRVGRELRAKQEQEEHALALESSHSKFHGRLTFSAPPHVPMAKRVSRQNYSHNERQLENIKYENEVLVKRLAELSKKKGPAAAGPPPPPVKPPSAAINRKKAAQATTAENFAIFKRLQAVRPSPDMRRDTLARQAREARKYELNRRQHRPHRTHSPSRHVEPAGQPELETSTQQEAVTS